MCVYACVRAWKRARVRACAHVCMHIVIVMYISFVFEWFLAPCFVELFMFDCKMY